MRKYGRWSSNVSFCHWNSKLNISLVISLEINLLIEKYRNIQTVKLPDLGHNFQRILRHTKGDILYPDSSHITSE